MSATAPALRFNPDARLQAVPLTPRQTCWVIDDALLEPRRWVEHAIAQIEAFAPSQHNAFPGPQLALPADATASLERFFALHVRRLLRMRRTMRSHARLSLVATQPQQLAPAQWLCHVDRIGADVGERPAACVLYLFDDPALGGTSFYAPQRPLVEIAALQRDAQSLSSVEFSARHDIPPEYMTGDNRWFRRLATVPARFNRIIFYDGGVFHCGQIDAPERLSPDPHHGRLTLNGFFVCRPELAFTPEAP